MQDQEIDITSSETWGDDSWFKNQEKRIFFENEGMFVINKGGGTDTIVTDDENITLKIKG